MLLLFDMVFEVDAELEIGTRPTVDDIKKVTVPFDVSELIEVLILVGVAELVELEVTIFAVILLVEVNVVEELVVIGS